MEPFEEHGKQPFILYVFTENKIPLELLVFVYIHPVVFGLSETINFRYSVANSAVIIRGKAVFASRFRTYETRKPFLEVFFRCLRLRVRENCQQEVSEQLAEYAMCRLLFIYLHLIYKIRKSLFLKLVNDEAF